MNQATDAIQNIQRRRLDEILIERGYVTKSQVREALTSQKVHGGKFGSHLLRHNFIDESRLVEALSIQLHCPGVVLSSLKIPRDVVSRVPKEVALARKIMPFQYDSRDCVLRIACEDPTDESLSRELSFISPGTRIELQVAAQSALDSAIDWYYLGRGARPDDQAMLNVLMVTDEEEASALLTSLLDGFDYKLVTADSIDAAVDLLEKQVFHTVFVKNSLAGDKADLVERVRRTSPSTVVRYYKNAPSLLLDEAPTVDAQLFLKNLDVLTMLLASRAQTPVNYGVRIAGFADRLCRKMRLPDGDRLVIANAAYLIDAGTSYYGPDKNRDHRQSIDLTVRLLESLDCSPTVVQVLRLMYSDLAGYDSFHLPIGVLGGNILTAVDILCQTVREGEQLSLDRLDAVGSQLRDLVGKTLLEEVVQGLTETLQEMALDARSARRSPQVMIYSQDRAIRLLLERKLRSEGYRTVSPESAALFTELYERSQPDIVVLAASGSSAKVLAFLDEMKDTGIGFDATPTVLVTDGSAISSLSSLLNRGVQDVVLLDASLDVLVSKVRHLAARIFSQAGKELEGSGTQSATHGQLSDMNLLDLLQALGPGRKTAKITVIPKPPEVGCLTLYLEQGRIVFAETENRTGADAVLEALRWVEGTWTLDYATLHDIPAHNNSRANEAILMEWCRLQDETVEAGVT